MRIQFPTLLLILLAVVFLVVGLGVLLWGITGSQTAIASQQWPSVPGQVTASRVTSSTDSEGATLYGAEITYTYTINDRAFASTQVSFGDYTSSDTDHAEDLTSRYPAERSVTVYYDPQNPARAVLEPGFAAGLLIPLGLGGVFSLAGAGMLVGFLTAIRRGIL